MKNLFMGIFYEIIILVAFLDFFEYFLSDQQQLFILKGHRRFQCHCITGQRLNLTASQQRPKNSAEAYSIPQRERERKYGPWFHIHGSEADLFSCCSSWLPLCMLLAAVVSGGCPSSTRLVFYCTEKWDAQKPHQECCFQETPPAGRKWAKGGWN